MPAASARATVRDYPGYDHLTGQPTPDYIRDGQGVTWTPHIGRTGEVGFRVEHHDGTVRFILLVPSADDTGGTSNVFLYESTDPTGDDPGDPITYVAPFGERNQGGRA